MNSSRKSPSPRIYTYKVTFPHQGWWYWGWHKERKLGENYSGSPKTHKEKWDNFEWEMQILEFFDCEVEAQKVENRLIRPDLNNPNCLNEHCGSVISSAACKRAGLTTGSKPETLEQCKQMGLKFGRKNISAYNDSKAPEQRKEHARKASLSADQEKRKQRMRETQKKFNPAKGTRWATNGVINKRITNNVLPDGFKWGMLKR